MQNQLIPVKSRPVGSETIQTVNARDLHLFLEVGKVFAAWLPERIEQFGFVENSDFIVFSESGNNPKGGRPAKEYALSIDMAKELSMVERNAKGKQARQYFIECERRAKDPVALLNDPAALRGLLISYSEKVVDLETTVQELKPKAQALDRLERADGLLCITDAAKHIGIRPKDLFRFMSAERWIFKRAGSKDYTAYQNRIQQGCLEVVPYTVNTKDGDKLREQVKVTPKGLSKLAKDLPPLWEDGTPVKGNVVWESDPKSLLEKHNYKAG